MQVLKTIRITIKCKGNSCESAFTCRKIIHGTGRQTLQFDDRTAIQRYG